MPVLHAYPALDIPTDSEWSYHTGGRNSLNGNGLVDAAGVRFTPNSPTPPGGATVFATILTDDGLNILYGPVRLDFIDDASVTADPALAPFLNNWMTVIPSNVCLTMQGPWIGKLEVHGPGGAGDTKFKTMWNRLVEEGTLN